MEVTVTIARKGIDLANECVALLRQPKNTREEWVSALDSMHEKYAQLCNMYADAINDFDQLIQRVDGSARLLDAPHPMTLASNAYETSLIILAAWPGIEDAGELAGAYAQKHVEVTDKYRSHRASIQKDLAEELQKRIQAQLKSQPMPKEGMVQLDELKEALCNTIEKAIASRKYATDVDVSISTKDAV